ncbi:hypothetical protein [Deinococcus koreensis]|uniref:Uncharacterized protein n=1 Tax=Deinococcus koreensis TaxID=2054903 RepID=A0A2K3UUM3_9DEIO|nr:hypothetical protein [Deinococcus koreensis]PNY80235.1 hypothetical protein CVO96_01650 [Deinococcus koreensis]
MPTREFLMRRNALWQQLRLLSPGSPDFEGAVRDLCALTGWKRERVLAGLGLSPAELPPGSPA